MKIDERILKQVLLGVAGIVLEAAIEALRVAQSKE